MFRSFGVAGVVAVMLAGCAADAAVAPEGQGGETTAALRHRGPELGTCDSLAVPAGHRWLVTLSARGDQIYRWDGASWAFAAPSARLFASRYARRPVGSHYAGPTWESISGSKVVGSVVRRCPASPTAIPWLLLGGASTETPGVFRGVTYIQRLNTRGGLAPTQPGSTVGEVVNVPYTADYAFYRPN